MAWNPGKGSRSLVPVFRALLPTCLHHPPTPGSGLRTYRSIQAPLGTGGPGHPPSVLACPQSQFAPSLPPGMGYPLPHGPLQIPENWATQAGEDPAPCSRVTWGQPDAVREQGLLPALPGQPPLPALHLQHGPIQATTRQGLLPQLLIQTPKECSDCLTRGRPAPRSWNVFLFYPEASLQSHTTASRMPGMPTTPFPAGPLPGALPCPRPPLLLVFCTLRPSRTERYLGRQLSVCPPWHWGTHPALTPSKNMSIPLTPHTLPVNLTNGPHCAGGRKSCSAPSRLS